MSQRIKPRITKIAQLSILFLSTCFAGKLFAAGFQLIEQSAVTLGLAGAGTTVNDNPSIQFYNPAGMAFITHPEFAASAIGIFPNVSYHTLNATNLSGNPVSGTSTDPAPNAFIPAFYAIYPVTNAITVGVGAEVPFGLQTIYGPDSDARYLATQSSIQTMNFNPSFSIKASDNFSVGFGIDVLTVHATLDQAIDTQSIYFHQVNSDVIVENKASDTGLGWNMGLMWKLTPTTELGFGYHSQIRLDMHGNSNMIGISADDLLAYGLDGIHDSYVDAPITLPDYATLSIKQQIKPWWDVLADLSYTHWSLIKNISLTFSGNRNNPYNFSNNLPPSVLPVYYRNTWRISLGQEFQILPIWKLRMGIAYDESPVRGLYRDVRLPDNDRYWLSLGSNFKFNQHFDLDVGYAHVFFKNSHVNDTQPISSQLQYLNFVPANFTADYKANVNTVGVQLNYHFT